MKKLLITSTGRSGTGFISQLLQNCGLRVSHEHWTSINKARNPRQIKGLPAGHGESSWLMAGVLTRRPDLIHDRDKVLLVHQVREPLVTMRSWMKLNKLRNRSAYDEFVFGFFPALQVGCQQDAMITHWVTWHRMIQRLSPDITYRVESMSFDLLSEILDRAKISVSRQMRVRALARTSKKTNTRGQKDWRPERASKGMVRSLMEYAAGYGYSYSGEDLRLQLDRPARLGSVSPQPKEDVTMPEEIAGRKVLTPYETASCIKKITLALALLAGADPDRRVSSLLEEVGEVTGLGWMSPESAPKASPPAVEEPEGLSEEEPQND